LSFPASSDGKESACNEKDLGWEDPLEEGMETHPSIHPWRIPMQKQAWWVTVHGVVKSWTQYNIPGLSYSFPGLESTIFPRSSDSFSWEIVLSFFYS